MTKKEIEILVEDMISMRDKCKEILSRKDLDTLADACNLIYKNRDKLKE